MEDKKDKLSYLQGKLDSLLENERLIESLMSATESKSPEYKAMYNLWNINENNINRLQEEITRTRNGTEVLTGYEGIGYSDKNINFVLERNFDSDELGISKDLEQQINEYLEEPSLDELKKAIDETDELLKLEENK